MISITPPNFYNQKEVENYFILLIIHSNTPEEAFQEYCKYETCLEIQEISKSLIESEYDQIKRRYGSSLFKELL